MNLILAPNHPEARDPSQVGGKAVNLARLSAVPGIACPLWFAIAVDAFRMHVAQPSVAASLAEARSRLSGVPPDALADAAAAARAAIQAGEMPPDAARSIADALEALGASDDFVAVRSSALGEDAGARSFAGQLDSFLFVRGTEAVLDAVRRCWASAYSDRAVVYRRTHRIADQAVEVAVVVQRMLRPAASGVVFTADPVTGDRNVIVVNATWGLGEGVVQGEFVTDTWRLAASGHVIRAEVRTKDHMMQFDPDRGGGTRVEAVPAEQADAPCLHDGELTALRAAARAVQAAFGRPQDLEFAVAEGRVYLLQARPITTLPAGPEDGPLRIWDNSNIIESYAGVTTPLTFSFIRRAYAIVYDQFLEVMGVSAAVRREHREMFRHMLGLIRGQVYYNLGNWYALIRFFPGYRINREFMENMMGVKERLEDDRAPQAPASAARRILVEYPRLGLLGIRSAWNLLTVDARMRRFLADFSTTHARFRAMDFDGMAPHELIGVYHELEARILRRWKPPIMSDFFAMIFYGVLRKLIVAWGIDPSGGLQNDLMCGDESIESSVAPRELMRIARDLRDMPAAVARFRTLSPAELVAWWRSDEVPEGPKAAFARYLDRFGDRGMHELMLEMPKPREDPAFLFAVLTNYVTADQAPDPEAMSRRQAEVKAAAEARARAALGTARTRLGVRRSAVFGWVLREARRHVRNRENQRLARTRAFSLVRQLFLALGRRIQEAGALREPDDIFYLALEEVFDFVDGTTVTVRIQDLADLRRKEFAAYREEPPADARFRTYGPVHLRNRFQGEAAPPSAEPDEPGLLRGTPCCGGVVRGKVRVIRSPSDRMTLDGEILVAEKTDPGWIPLYPSVSGLLIERGSVLSHSAIVAREMGKPAIVGIPRLIETLRDGDEVEMDGAAGTVRVL